MTNTSNSTSGRRVFLYAAIGLIATIWAGVFAALAIVQPSLHGKMAIVAVGAGLTELVLYAGAAWFGISIFKRVRDKIRLRRR